MMRCVSGKVLFVSSISVVILSDISLATFSYLRANSEEHSFLESLGFFPLIFVTCIVSAHSVGIFPVMQMLMGELFPSDLRSLSIGLTISAGLCLGTTNILVYTYLVHFLQFFGTFYFYASVQFLALIWGFCMIPDNRGLSLAKVEEKFASSNVKKRQPEPV
jgi:MFS family permease